MMIHHYSTPDEMQNTIDAYLNKCEANHKPPTVSGLAYTLGFLSRNEILNYNGQKVSSTLIKRALLMIETYVEECLFDKDKHKGALFSLRCSYGWNDKNVNMYKPVEQTIIVNDVKKP